MGRTVFIEESIEPTILRLFGATTWRTGLLIGQPSSQRDYVVHLALTPPQEKSTSGRPEKPNQLNNRDATFNEDWFIQHCCQVNRMVTGGLKILGIFVFGPPKERSEHQSKFRQLLYSIHKTLLSDLPLKKLNLEHADSSHKVLMQVCSTTKKMTCFTIDVSDSKASFNPSDVKYHNFTSKWTALHCSVALDLKLSFEKKLASGSLYPCLKAGLWPVLAQIANSLGTVNSVLMSDSQLLIHEKQKHNSERKKEVIAVDLYLTKTEFEPSIKRKSRNGHALLVGTLQSWAYVHSKATVKEAIEAVKCDVIRDLVTRCQLLCEDMNEKNFQGDEAEDDLTVTSWTLPNRIFVPICEGPLKVSDCMFKDEETEDVLHRLSQMLGVPVPEQHLISSQQFSDYVDLACLQTDTDFEVDPVIQKPAVDVPSKSTKCVLAGLMVAFFAIIIAACIKVFRDDSQQYFDSTSGI